MLSWIVCIRVAQHQHQRQQINQHHGQRTSQRRGQHNRHQNQPSQPAIVPITINTVPLGRPLANVARIQLIWINIVVNHAAYVEAVVVVEEAAPMPVLIVTIGHSMVIADQIMHIWVNHVEKRVAFAEVFTNINRQKIPRIKFKLWFTSKSYL